MSSFVNQNSRKWLDEANASNIASTSDDGDGSSICIDRLYSSNAEEKREAIKHIATLLKSDMDDTDDDTDDATKHPKTTLELVADNKQLLSALARMLREDCVTSELCQIYFHLSLFPEYHPLLLSHGIGSLLMDHLIRKVKGCRIHTRSAKDEADVNGEETRDDQSVLFDAGGETDGTDTDANAIITCGDDNNNNSSRLTATASGSAPSSSSSALSSNQEQIISLCLAILDNLADDVDVRRKMFKSGQLLTLLFSCLICKTADCVVRSLLLLRKGSMFEEVVDELYQNDGAFLQCVIHVAVKRSQSACSTESEAEAKEGNGIVADHVIRLLFNASFHKECRKTMADTQALIDLLTSMARNENSSSCQVCTNLLKILCLEMVHSCCEENSQLCIEK